MGRKGVNMTRKKYYGLMRELHRRCWDEYQPDSKRSHFNLIKQSARVQISHNRSYDDMWGDLLSLRQLVGM